MGTIDEYLKGILGQILVSYKILTELNDNPDDLEIIKKELAKIRELLHILHTKLDNKKTIICLILLEVFQSVFYHSANR